MGPADLGQERAVKERIAGIFGFDQGRLWTLRRVAGVVFMVAVVCAIVAGAACTGGQSSPPSDAKVEPTPGEGGQQTSPDAELADITRRFANAVATIETNRGTIEFKVFSKDAPMTVANFAKLADSKFYDGVKWHRIEKGFVVQGGDPQTQSLSAAQVKAIVTRQQRGEYRPGEPMIGSGGPGYTIAAEFNRQKHVTGTVAMARAQDPNSGGSQFYICLAPQPALDGQYTVFGQVTSGMDVVKKLQIGDVMRKVTVAGIVK